MYEHPFSTLLGGFLSRSAFWGNDETKLVGRVRIESLRFFNNLKGKHKGWLRNWKRSEYMWVNFFSWQWKHFHGVKRYKKNCRRNIWWYLNGNNDVFIFKSYISRKIVQKTHTHTEILLKSEKLNRPYNQLAIFSKSSKILTNQ